MTKQEFLRSSGLQVRTLELWIKQEWLVPEETPAGIRFGDIDIARAQFIRELKTDIGANDEGIGVILHLVDQLHGMRRALAALHAKMQDDDD
ncbi:MAG: MerR family transcriptional regulator [Rhizobiaceae bacterium]|jgi:chaperone modulatory protein CbpM|nr:MAG: MerR family transcriptional regulator [Rhizobiaceae bacterium]